MDIPMSFETLNELYKDIENMPVDLEDLIFG